MKELIKKLLRESAIDEDITWLPDYLHNQEFIEKLAKKLGYSLVKELGSGTNGTAYLLNNNVVLKLTSDISEFIVASKLVGKKMRQISDVYAAYKINNHYVYVILLEYLEPLPDDVYQRMMNYGNTAVKHRSELFPKTMKQIKEIGDELVANGIKKPTDIGWYLNMGIKNGLLAVFDEKDVTIIYHDYNPLDVSDLL